MWIRGFAKLPWIRKNVDLDVDSDMDSQNKCNYLDGGVVEQEQWQKQCIHLPLYNDLSIILLEGCLETDVDTWIRKITVDS